MDRFIAVILVVVLTAAAALGFGVYAKYHHGNENVPAVETVVPVETEVPTEVVNG